MCICKEQEGQLFPWEVAGKLFFACFRDQDVYPGPEMPTGFFGIENTILGSATMHNKVMNLKDLKAPNCPLSSNSSSFSNHHMYKVIEIQCEIVDAYAVPDWICNINFYNIVRKGDGFNPISIKKLLHYSSLFPPCSL